MTTTATPSTPAPTGGTPTTPTTEPTTTPTPTTESTTTPEPTETVEHWKEMARKNEQRAKENAQKAKDYDALKASTMSENDKALQTARDEGRAEGSKAGASKIAQAEIRAAAAGRSVDVDALLEGVDASKFIDTDGEVDRAAIVAWVDKVAPAGTGTGRVPDLGQGARGGQQTTGDPARDLAQFISNQLGR